MGPGGNAAAAPRPAPPFVPLRAGSAEREGLVRIAPCEVHASGRGEASSRQGAGAGRAEAEPLRPQPRPPVGRAPVAGAARLPSELWRPIVAHMPRVDDGGLADLIALRSTCRLLDADVRAVHPELAERAASVGLRRWMRAMRPARSAQPAAVAGAELPDAFGERLHKLLRHCRRLDASDPQVAVGDQAAPWFPFSATALNEWFMHTWRLEALNLAGQCVLYRGNALQLARVAQLRALNLDRTVDYGDASKRERLLDLRPLTELNHLSVQHNALDGQQLRALLPASARKLRSLAIGGNAIEASIGQLPWDAWPQLRQLSLCDVARLHGGPSRLLCTVPVPVLHGLVELDVSDTHLFASDLAATAFREAKSLRRLIMRRCGLHDPSMPVISFAPDNQLQTWVLSDNTLTAAGLAWLATMPLSALQSLVLDDNPLGSGAAQALDSASVAHLRERRVDRCELGADGLLRLRASPLVQNLSTFSGEGNVSRNVARR